MRATAARAVLCLTLVLPTLPPVPALGIGPPKSSTSEPVRAKSKKPDHDKGFESAEAVLQWINNYRDNRTPARLPVAVQSMSRLGLFRDMDGAGVYVGFIAGVLGDNPAQAAALVEKMFPMPPEEQTVLIRGIAFSGLADWKGLLTKFSERMPARRTLIEKHLADKAETLQNLPLDTGPAPVDTLWGFYFATGSAEPVLRILTALPWSTDTRDVNKLTVGSMAKWTLASNAMREKPLLDLLRDQVERQPKEVQTPLRDVITAAETYEIARIRKEAMNSIEELKRKGPSPTAWGWGVAAAPTVVGLACVAASVAGAVALGIPCIVTGAVSSAAAKWWSP
jgi:hypothetical protein